MKRKLLLSIPETILEPWDIPDYQEVKKSGRGGKYTEKRANYVYTAYVDDSTGERVLILDLYRPSGIHLWRMFQDENSYYFRRLENGKLSEAGLDHTICDESKSGNWSYWDDRNFHAAPETEEIILSFLHKKPWERRSAVDALRDCHQNAKESRLKDRYRKIREMDDLKMLEIRELPREVIYWIDRNLMKNSRYFFYRSVKRKTTSGCCTHCKKTTDLPTPRDGKTGKCPECGSPVTFLPLGRFLVSNGFQDKSEFWYLQSTAKGFCARRFGVTWSFEPRNGGFWLGKNLFEEQRNFFNWSNDRSGYITDANFTYGDFRQSGERRFCRQDWENTPSGRFYPGNLNRILRREDTAWYLSWNEIARYCKKVDLINLITKPVQCPFIPNLVKAGLYRLAQDCINQEIPDRTETDGFRPEAGSIRKALGIGKDELPALRFLDPTMREFRLYQEVCQRGGKPEPAEFKELYRMVGENYHLRQALRSTTVHSLLRYLTTQEKKYPKRNSWGGRTDSYANVLNDWADYQGNALLLGMNLKNPSVRFPKDLKHAHDEAYQAVNAAERREGGMQISAIAAMQKELESQFGFGTKKFLIRAPRDHREVIQEGERLHHCVSTYAKQIARGESIILFIRRAEEPEVPYFTLELDPDSHEVRQCRGLRNCDYGEDVKKFIEQWKQRRLALTASA